MTKAAEPTEFPVLFWAAVILFVVNLLVLFGIWISPQLRVSMYGEEEGALAGTYARPSPFTERVSLSVSAKPRQPEKVRPVLYQEPESAINAELALPRTTMRAAMERSVSTRNVDHIVQSYSEYPRMSASLNTDGERVRHVGTVDVAPRRLTEQP